MKPERCIDYREWIHRALDGESLDFARRRALDEHLAQCAGCRKARAELQRVQQALRDLPRLTLPDADLEQVFARTSRSRDGRRWRVLDWRVAAAAAVLAVALWGLWPAGQSRPEYTQAELEQAAAEARWALKTTAEALKRTERIGIQEVLGEEVAPALRRVPVKLPGGPVEREGKPQT